MAAFWGCFELNFQVNDQTYFFDFADEAGQCLVFVETPNGPRPVRIYEDAAPFEDVKVIVEDQNKRKIVN